jgi:hypothetical protein
MRHAVIWFLLGTLPCLAYQPGDLPGIEVSSTPGTDPSLPSPHVLPPDSSRGVNWLSPPVEEQLARDPTLLTLGKGALFVPTFSEPRREPEVSVFDSAGHLVTTGQTGTRILVDTGSYEVRLGSGVNEQRLHIPVHIQEGHTTVLPPSWGGLLVEMLTDSGEYIDGQYDLIRMSDGVSYGLGNGFTEERLQDIKVWILPPGLYRLSKTGESYNSLQNYITVEINPGELHSIELIFDKSSGGNLIAGGAKSLTTPTVGVGRHWVYGVRGGGNLNLVRTLDETGLQKQSLLFSTALNARARYDQPQYFGINEIFLQNSFLKGQDAPLTATTDLLQVRSTWVRRFNPWIGPYLRGQLSSHVFPTLQNLDTTYRVRTSTASGTLVTDTLSMDTSKSFRSQPSFFPMALAEGMGVNLQWISRYQLELSTEVGLAARQQISDGDYLARTPNSFERAQSSSSVGVEGVLIGTLRLSTKFTLDLRAEIFAEDGRPDAIQFDDLEADFRLFLAHNLEIDYLYQMTETLDRVVNRYPSQQSLSLQLSFNY